MPSHNIIDNRSEKLVDHINRVLESSEAGRFAVGYFFISGLVPFAKRLEKINELRLLIGNTTNRETIEQIAEGYQRLEEVKDTLEGQSYPRRADSRRMAKETAENVRTAMEIMVQSDEGEDLISGLINLIEEKRLQVRVYTKGRLHAKAYIFDYGKVYDDHGKPVERHEDGIAIVGSSNLTLSGITHNTELNVIVQGNDNHSELVRWFEDLWAEAEDFDEALMHEMSQSWVAAEVSPYDIYMKTLFNLVKDRLEGDDEKEILWDDEITAQLADFQKVALRHSIQIVKDYGGAFVADVVGLGKSFIGSAIVKHFERAYNKRPLIICPAPLVDMWERYNEVYQLNARVLSMGYLRESKDSSLNILLEDVKFRDREFILVDESHNFRHSSTQRYSILQSYLGGRAGRFCCFLTATPRNKSAWDIYHQIKLFHQDERTDLPIDPPNFKDYFKLVDAGERKLPELLSHILIRRTRNHILRWYGYDSETHQPVDPTVWKEYREGKRRAYVIVAGKPQFFPKRKLQTVEYSIEDTYLGLYKDLRDYLGRSRKRLPKEPLKMELTYARYGLWHYVHEEKQRKEPYASLHRAGANLRGLMRILLFKRFESSVYAFKETVRRLLNMHALFVTALENGIVPAGEDAQTILYESDFDEESMFLDAIRDVSKTYNAADFNIDLLKKHIQHDTKILREILGIIEPISPEKDTKLQVLKEMLRSSAVKRGKRLIFTQYADTARYIFENIVSNYPEDEIDVIYSGDKSKERVVGRFAPKANPEYKFAKGESELHTLVTTDVLAEGLNLQDGDKVINYDLHWNPVRLIQRFGRIDRIGSEHDKVYGFNFLPETGIDRQLGLKGILKSRIQEIHDTIGEDAAILDPSERLNEEAMYAIYEMKGDYLAHLEDEEEDIFDINEAEQMMRQLRAENPEEYDRIANLRDGIRTAQATDKNGFYVFCQSGRYQQLFQLDEKGEIITRDIPRILSAIKAAPSAKSLPLPKQHNKAVTRIRQQFEKELKQIESERKHRLSLTHGQRYVLRELRLQYELQKDDETKAEIAVLEKTYRGPLSRAVIKELNLLRRNGVSGDALLKNLIDIYYQHNLKEYAERKSIRRAEDTIPRIICSEALLESH
ncbi:helicase-related protein [Candidatus Neomarinimicrobiota bacterium]